MNVRQFSLFQQIIPSTPMPWRITETHPTVDGYRTRFVDGAWATKEEAWFVYEQLNRGLTTEEVRKAQFALAEERSRRKAAISGESNEQS